MAKDKLTDYDSVASSNLDVGGISVAEGMLPSGVNNAIREQMSHLADFAAGTSGVDVLKLQDDTDTNSIKLQAPASVTTTTTFTLPDGDGASGQTMITDGAGTLSWAAPYGNRNLIMNGAFTVAQRGTSATVANGSPLTVDRFSVHAANFAQASFTESQSTTVPSGEGFANSLKVVCGVTPETTLDATDHLYIRYRGNEGQDVQHLQYGTSNAKKVTASFWVRSSVTGDYAVMVYTNAGIGGGAVARSQTKTYTINSANTWEYKTITFDGDGASGNALANDNSAEWQVYFTLASGATQKATDGTSWGAYATGKFSYGQTADLSAVANSDWYITGVQFEVGETATPFEHRSYGDELARCQRYYEEWGGELAFQPFGYLEGTGTVGFCVLQFTEKRDAPTVTVSDPAHFHSVRSSIAFTAMSFSQPVTTHVICTISRSTNNWPSGEIFSWRANNSTAARIYFNAEL